MKIMQKNKHTNTHENKDQTSKQNIPINIQTNIKIKIKIKAKIKCIDICFEDIVDTCVTHDVVNEESGQGCLCDTRCCAGMKNMKVTDESEFMRGKRGECACTLVLCVMLHVCLHVFTSVSM